MKHDEFCRFAKDDRKDFKAGCFDCQRLEKARNQEREQIAQRVSNELDAMMPPVDSEEMAIYNAMNWVINMIRKAE